MSDHDAHNATPETAATHGHEAAQATGHAGATVGAAAAPQSAAVQQLNLRLKSAATPDLIGFFLAEHVDHKEKDAVIHAMQTTRGNAFSNKALAIWNSTPKGKGPLHGAMLVSNNPEGLMSPGKVVSAQADKGELATYIHHSNHTKTPLDLYLVVKPAAQAGESFTADLSGAAAADHGTRHAKASKGHDGPSRWETDPNVVVAAANTSRDEKGDPNAGLVNTAQMKGAKPAPFHLGRIPAGAGKADAPLFDARYDVKLSAAAEIDIVAEAKGGGAAAEGEAKMADGNTKYQVGDSAGRGAGIYKGANFTEDDQIQVSKLPHSTELTGGKRSPVESPKLAGAGMATQVPPAAMIEKAIKDAGPHLGKAAVAVLDAAFRIAPQWLAEKKVWDGTNLTADGLSGDYQKIINGTLAAVKADHAKGGAAHTLAVIAAHPTVSADGDYASYGTMFELGYMLHNDGKTDAKIGMNFVTDTEFNAAGGGEAQVYRGVVSVDGVDYPIAHDHGADGKGKPAAAEAIGGTIDVKPDVSKYVAVQFQSPGQISGGQRLDIKKK